jgi:hypothetical protein
VHETYVSSMDRGRNEEVRIRCGSEPSIGERVDRNVLSGMVLWGECKKTEWLKKCTGRRLLIA